MPPKKTDDLFILIRGLGRESGHWGDFPQKLESQISGLRVKCIDLPGTGENIAMQSPVKMRGLSEFVRHEVQYFKMQNKLGGARVFVLAPSLGGMIAADWMMNYPQDLSGAILINTSFASWSTFWQRLQVKSYQHILRIVLSEKDPVARESAVVKMVSNHKDRMATHAKKWAEVYQLRPIRHETLVRQLLAARDFVPLDTKISTPVLLLSSENDQMVDPSCSQIIQRKWDCALIQHPWAGHDIPLDDPDWVIEKSLIWYKSLGKERELLLG
jgi:pimeloyl-ACP methyl ester carboxylesterase